MLHELKSLIGSRVLATDGTIGAICTFLFDDRSWTIRYIVVDVGNWLGHRRVVLTLTGADQPSWNDRGFRVGLTRRQIRHSPHADTHKPVSRQQTLAMREYFGPFACWVDVELGTASLPTRAAWPVPASEDPHLWSVGNMLGYEVWSPQGRLGRIQGFVVDEHALRIGYLDVQGASRHRDRALLLPTASVRCISWPDHRVYLAQQSQARANLA
jgi:hypothetical protein